MSVKIRRARGDARIWKTKQKVKKNKERRGKELNI
jgi:hypothetical protein